MFYHVISVQKRNCHEMSVKPTKNLQKYLSWRLLGHSWGALGRSWVALGRSWEALGRLLGALGLFLAALGAILERHAKIIKKSMPKMIDLGSQKPPKMAPKSNPKATKNRCKKRSEKNIELRPPWGCLGAILADLGLILGSILVKKPWKT